VGDGDAAGRVRSPGGATIPSGGRGLAAAPLSASASISRQRDVVLDVVSPALVFEDDDGTKVGLPDP